MITNSILSSIIRILHYATDAEKTVRAGGDGLSKMDRHKSCCVDFAKSHLASSLVREYARKVLLMDEEAAREYWNRHKDRIIKAIATVDHRIIISEDKDNFQTELRIVVAKDKTNMSVLDLIGAMNAAYHQRYYNLRTGGKKLSTIMMSITLWDTVLDRCDPVETAFAYLRGAILHSEGWLAGYIKNALTYTDDILDGFERTIAEGFADIFEHILKVNDGPFYDTDIAHRFANGKLTKEEVEALRKLLLAIRIRGGTTCGLMRTLVKAIIRSLMSSKNIQEEEAIDLIPKALEELDRRYQSEQRQEVGGTSSYSYSYTDDTSYAAYDKLIEHQPKKIKEVRLKFDKFVVKLNGLYLGSQLGVTTTGLMKTLAKEIYRLDGMTADSSIHDIMCKLEELNRELKSDPSGDDQVITAFSRLIKHKPDIVEDLESPATKLQILHLGSKLGGELGGTTTGLMKTLAKEIYSLPGMTTDSSIMDIMYILEELNRRYNKVGSRVVSNDETLGAFLKLSEHMPSIADDFESLSSKLRNLHLGVLISDRMTKLARSLVFSAMSRGSDVEQAKRQIQSELELVKTQFSSSKSAGEEARTTNSNSAMSMYDALVKLNPVIAEECTATLSPKLYNIVSELNVAWEARLVELKQYKLTVFDPSNTNNSKPFVVGDDNISLRDWFLRQMNLFGVSGWLDNMRLISSYMGSTKIDELWKLILVQRRQKLENAGITFIDPSERRKKPGRADELRRKQRKRKLN